MDSIQTALDTFKYMANYTYDFVIAHDKELHGVRLTFDYKDFHHLVGLHYLNDIDIPKSQKKLFQQINSGKINDTYLSTSENYLKVKNSDAIVKDRIYHFRNIEKFLDSRNLVFNYVGYMNKTSKIEADYMIKSSYKGVDAYIFLRERSNNKNNEYCICSFFTNPFGIYTGQKAYWWYKAKTDCQSNSIKIFIDKMSKNK